MNLRSVAKKLLRRAGVVSVLLQHLGRLLERIVFGGNLREAVLLTMLKAHYASRLRRQWIWYSDGQEPHFFDHRVDGFNFVFGKNNPTAVFIYLRGLF